MGLSNQTGFMGEYTSKSNEVEETPLFVGYVANLENAIASNAEIIKDILARVDKFDPLPKKEEKAAPLPSSIPNNGGVLHALDYQIQKANEQGKQLMEIDRALRKLVG